ncbi:YdcF family protein [Terrisporobacter petrolearius]|uniref:YdcF family protein n=1 Tax=Terrisporobacter petrolearius TaxID=1460447 RepID=UPI001D16E3A7|nr:YdcF family protein [Terrisporobacter petrolearius]MCC3863851.1 YdcF family protein [Terrisporobacter petrolearius]
MNKNIKLLIVLSIPIILALSQWGLSFSTVFVIVSMILIYLLISAKNIDYKNKYTKIIYKIYKTVMILFITSFILLQSAIIINMHKAKDVNSTNSMDTMIVLGAKVNKEGVSKTLKQRLDKAIEYYNENKHLNIIVSGGQGKDEVMSEAWAMKNYLVKNGVNKNNIILENKATTTLENIMFSKEIMEDLKLENKALIVTSDYHLFRGRFIASMLGIDNEGLCSTSSLSSRIYYMIREYPTSIIDFYRSIKEK